MSSVLESLDYQDSYRRSTKSEFNINFFLKSVNPSNDVLMDDEKPLVTKKPDFEKRENLLFLSVFGILGKSRH